MHIHALLVCSLSYNAHIVQQQREGLLMKGAREEKVNAVHSGGLHGATSGVALWEYD